MVHELTPSDHHHRARMIVESVIRMYGSGHHTRQRQLASSHRDTRGADAIRVQRSDEPLERCHCGTPCGVLDVIAETVEATILAGPTLDAGQKRRTHLADQRLAGVDEWQSLFNVFVREAVAVKQCQNIKLYLDINNECPY